MNHKSNACLIIRCLLFVLSVYPAGALAQVETSPKTNPNDSLQRTTDELATTVARAIQENAALRLELAKAEQEVKGSDITPRMLEQARLDIASVSAQVDNLKNREETRSEALADLEKEIAQLEADLRTAATSGESPDLVKQAAQEAAIRDKKGTAATLQVLIERLAQYREQAELRLNIVSDRLALMQGRFRIPARDSAGAKDDPRRQKVQRALDRLLESAARLRTEAAAVTGDAPDEVARKRLLEVQALDADERAELMQLELKLLQLEFSLAALEELFAAESVPVDALRAAEEELAKVIETLAVDGQQIEAKRELVTNQRAVVEQRGVIGEGDGKTLEQQLQVMDELLGGVTQTLERIAGLKVRAETAEQNLERAISKGVRRELIERRKLPRDAEGWGRLAEGLATLPGRVAENLAQTLINTGHRLAGAPAVEWGKLLGLMLLLVLFFVWLNRFLYRNVIERRPDSSLAIPARAIRDNLLGLLPPAAWSLTGWLLELTPGEILLPLALLLVWPGVRLVLNMARQLLERAPDIDQAEGMRFYRELRWVLVIVGVLVALSVIAHAVAVSPSVEDALDRFSMLCLILIAVPALHLRGLILARSGRTGRGWTRLLASLSLVVPLVIIGCAFLGIIGYVNLAWSIAAHLGWAAVVVSAWLLLLGVLRDGVGALKEKLAQRYEGADFWSRNFIIPLYRLSTLGLMVLAGVALFRIYDWNRETPIIGWIPTILEKPLFSVGEASLDVQDIVLAAVLVFVVFWAGSWSKQVSFRLAYVKISDHGIRQSLSTVTQYLVVVLGLMIALKTIGLDLTALTVFAGALGVGIGFGLQNITNNFISGILLLAERPLQARDIVTVDSFEGEVTQIGIRSLTVKTWDDLQVVIPNSSVISKPFTNWTRGGDRMRTVLMVGIGYDDDPQQAMDIILAILREHPEVLDTPGPKVLLWDFGDSAVMLRLQFHSHIRGAVGRADLRSQVLMSIWRAFREHGITIPYPQSDVHIRYLYTEGSALPSPGN